MTGVRMSLEEAGKALGGLHPNTVRNRARNGKIPFEKDNSGKWWVFIDLEQAANDAKARASKSPTIEPALKVTNVSNFGYFEVTINAISRELEVVRAERDTLRAKASTADRSEALRAGLEAQVSATKREIERLRADRDAWKAEAAKWQEQAAQSLRVLASSPPQSPVVGQGKSVGGFWARLLGKKGAANE